LLSEESYLKAIHNPFAIVEGMAWAEWDNSNFAPELWVGSIKYVGGTSILEVDGELLLGFDPPEEHGAPPRLNARFFDRNQKPIFAIEQNEVTIQPDTFDAEATSNRWVIRSAPAKIDLEIQLEPPNRIAIPRLSYRYGQWGLDADEHQFSLNLSRQSCFQMTGPVTIEGPCLFK
jgi:hypothetical protein